MRFSVVTASLNQLPWLQRAARSVADQAVAVEHIVQDGGSGHEAEAWAAQQPQLHWRSERDHGLYQALNRGLARATGEILSILHCDEQLLAGALPAVEQYFQQHPETDLLVGDFLIIEPGGKLLAARKATPLRRSMVLVDHLYDHTCALFFRRELWERTGPFREDLQAVADAEWVARVLARPVRIGYLPQYLAAFTLTGQNVSLGRTARREERALRRTAPRWAQLGAPALRAYRHVEKLLKGAYWLQPVTYGLYTSGQAQQRTLFTVARPGSRHPWASGHTSQRE